MLCWTFCSFVMLNIFQRKMFSIKCIWCQNAFWQRNATQRTAEHFLSFDFLQKCICNILLCWTFSKGKCSASTKCDAEHFTKSNVMLNIFLWKMWCWTFSFGKCDAKMHFCTALRCVAKMHFGIKCIWCKNAFLQRIKCILASNAFLHQMHFCTAEHFPLENVRWTFYKVKCTRCQNAFWHQMHLMPKCILATQRNAQLNIFLWKMFSKTKCDAEHFTS